MRTYSWILVVAAATPLFPFACGGGATDTTATDAGAGGSATTGPTTAGSTTTAASGAGGGGGGAMGCSGVIDPSVCATCLEGSCCNELAMCGAANGCIACMGGDAASCVAENKEALDALTTCLDASCNPACTTTPPDAACTVPAVAPSNGACITLSADIKCNPVTNAPCAAGEACDFNTANGFICYPPPPANSEPVCAACSLAMGLACMGGETCINGLCVRFCCTDPDCGAGTCDKSASPGAIIGICLGAAPP